MRTQQHCMNSGQVLWTEAVHLGYAPADGVQLLAQEVGVGVDHLRPQNLIACGKLIGIGTVPTTPFDARNSAAAHPLVRRGSSHNASRHVVLAAMGSSAKNRTDDEQCG